MMNNAGNNPMPAKFRPADTLHVELPETVHTAQNNY